LQEINEDYQNGTEDEQLNELMDQYGQQIVRLIYTYVQDKYVAEDLAQEVFIKCYHNLSHFENRSSYSTWLYRIAVNQSKDYLKSSWVKKVKQRLSPKHVKEKVSSPEQSFLQNIEDQQLLTTVLSLPVKYREVIALHYFNDLSVKEMALCMNVNESTIYTRLRRAKDELKRKLDFKGGF
jgi:RNA polymerase sigma-70 factor, ECF subfamily